MGEVLAEVMRGTEGRYRECFERLVGKGLEEVLGEL